MKKSLNSCFLILIALSIAILSGCATTNFTLKNAMLANGQDEVNLLLEPYESLGLKETEAIRKNEITAVYGIFPDILFGEYFPGRIRWNGWVIDGNDREYFAQSLFSGVDYSGYFLETIIIDAVQLSSGAKMVIFSTAGDFIYDLAGNEYAIERKKFVSDNKYRSQIVREKGTPIGDLKKISGFPEIISNWNRYKTESGILLSPLGEKDIKLIAAINPQYTFFEKWVGSNHSSISIDWIAVAVGISLDILRTSNVPTTGWDYNSQLPSRRNMAFIIKYVAEMKQRLIKNINQQNINKYFSKSAKEK